MPAAALLLLSLPQCSTSKKSLTAYVNPLTGTAAASTTFAQGIAKEEYGNTIPTVCVPFAMTGWTPQTRTTEHKCVAPYYYKDTVFSGLRATHWISGSCTQDYGSFTVMPLTGSLETDPAKFSCPLDHQQETCTPYYYKVRLGCYRLSAELTATSRAALMRFTPARADSLYIIITPNSDSNKAFVRVDRARGEIVGYNPVHRLYQGSGQPAGFNGYFVIRFRQSFSEAGTFSGNGDSGPDSLLAVENEGAYAAFRIPKGSSLLAKAGTSFTSIAEARKNLEAEIPGWDFDSLKHQNRALWERQLGRIRVEGGSETAKQIFYTALYHTMQQPRLYNDVDGSYPRFASQYQTARLDSGAYYGDFSMWDIYRGVIPLYEILAPEKVGDWVHSMILKGQQGGWLPIFPCWNHYTAEMIGDHVTVMIASAYLKDIRGFDIGEAYPLMRRNAFDTAGRADYLDGKGRRALASYLQYGYIPLEDEVMEAFHKREQVSRTLEYAYDDYCLSLVAGKLGKEADEKTLRERAANYRHVFDPGQRLMNGRHADGTWYAPFEPDQRLRFVTESTPRQYSFYVPQDIPGLAGLMGGRDSLEAALDSLFTGTRYNHGNEPDQQAPFLYNYTSHPWKTQHVVHRILRDQYAPGPGGLSGNDDAGAISAWYILAAMGLYPADPASGHFLLSSPLFDKVSLSTGNDTPFVVTVHRASPSSIYIGEVRLNGKSYGRDFLDYATLMKGGTLEIFLQDTPGTWGAAANQQPPGL